MHTQPPPPPTPVREFSNPIYPSPCLRKRFVGVFVCEIPSQTDEIEPGTIFIGRERYFRSVGTKMTSDGKILAENAPAGPRSRILRFLGAPKVKLCYFRLSYIFSLSEGFCISHYRLTFRNPNSQHNKENEELLQVLFLLSQ